MPGYIEDRWWSKRPAPETDEATGRIKGEKYKLSRHGVGQRYRVCGIPGVKDESFDRLSDAKAWLASAQTDSRRGVFIDPALGQMLLADYVREIYWPGVSVAVGTKATMESKIRLHVVAHLGHLPLAAIDEEVLRIWVATLLKTQGVNTVRVIYNYLSAILATAVPKRLLRNPCSTRGIKPKPAERLARALTRQQSLAVREGLRPRDRMVFDLGIMAGLRQGEALGFAPVDVDREHGVIHLRRQLQMNGTIPYFKLPKGDKERDIPLSQGLLDRIDSYLEQFQPLPVTLPWLGAGGPDSGELTIDLLLCTRHRNVINRSSWNYDSWKAALAAAGLIKPWRAGPATSRHQAQGWEAARELGFHITRHTYASVQLQAGESILSLSRWLGHDDPAFTLRRYTHFMPEAGDRGRAAMDAWVTVI